MAAMLKREYRTACGGWMTTDETTEAYFAAHPDVLELLDEAIRLVTLPAEQGRKRFSVAVELGRGLGPASLVEATRLDPLLDTGEFVMRPGRAGMTRVVKVTEVDLPQVSTVVIIGEPTKDWEIYKLVTAYIGVVAPPEPWAGSTDPHPATKESLPFWLWHALVWQEAWGEPLKLTWAMVLEEAARGK